MDRRHNAQWARRLGVGLLAAALVAGSATLEGTPTVLLPLTIGVAFIANLRKAQRVTISKAGWTLASSAMGFALLGFLTLGLGFEAHHPVTVLLFIASYPLAVGSIFAFVSNRLAGSARPGNLLDGAIAGSVFAALMVRFAPAATEPTAWRSFVYVLFPILDIAMVSIIVAMGSHFRWRFPRQIGLLLLSSSFTFLSDFFPFIGVGFGLGYRASAAAALCVVAAVRSNDRWSVVGLDSASPRVFIASWVGAVGSLPLLVEPSQRLVPRFLAALALFLVVWRLSSAYGQARQEAELRREARSDELTDLPNRRALRERLDDLTKFADPFAFCILDLDAFKEVNDSLGHDAGDQLLRTVTVRMQRAISRSGLSAELFRIGGDEFAVIVRETEHAGALAKDLTIATRTPTVVANERIDQRVSIGIASYPDDAKHPGDLMRLADVAMYRAKQLRSGYEMHDSGLSEEFSQVRLLATVRDALASGEFDLHYQPQVSLSDGSIVGVEALFRLSRNGKLLPTDAVIAAVDAAGLLAELTNAVVDRSVRELRDLLPLRPNLTLSLNVSAEDLSSGTLVDRVLPILRRYGVKQDRLCIEVTEESLLHDPVSAAATVDALRANGISVSMDDFGVGFSSLTNLRILAVDELKIDRSFVAGLLGDARTEALVVSIVELARRLGAKVLIEGVEHLDEVTMARSLGVDRVQGYVFSRPLPFDELVEWIRNYARTYDRLSQPHGLSGGIPLAVQSPEVTGSAVPSRRT